MPATTKMSETRQGLVAAGPGDFEPHHIPLGALPLPAAGEAHAWFLDLGQLARSLQHALGGDRAEDFDGDAPLTPGQLRFARRFYLRLLLGAYLGVPGKSVHLNRRERGKPVLDASRHSEPLHFSMAKSADRLLIGLASQVYLGVDLEPVARKPKNALGVARRYFSEPEAAALSALPDESLDSVFVRTWACKEAVVKASGQGIANQLHRFSVETDPRRSAAVLDFEGDDAKEWSLQVLSPEPGFLGAVAARARGLRIQAFRLLPADG
jgi:4'-phosphopantetheinyl transferase